MSRDARAEWVPRLREDLEVTDLPLSDPFEGFILSRIDGFATLQEIADSTGASLDKVWDLMTRLEGLGALGGAPDPPIIASRPPPAPDNGPPSVEISGPVHQPSIAPPPGSVAPVYDPRELDETADLPPERKHEILDTFHRLGDMNHYELLGVARDSEKKEIREAYFRLSKRFHPDTLFGKSLGSFKTKMERVFERLTAAYETLGKKKTRRAYDEYLKMQDETKALETELEDGEAAARVAEQHPPSTPPPDPSPDAARRELETAKTDRPPGPAPVEVPKVEAPEIGDPEPARRPPRSPMPKMTAAERRALARKLMQRRISGSGPPSSQPPRHSTKPPSDRPQQSREELLRGLTKSLRQTAAFTGGVDKARKFVDEAELKVESGDLLGAVNALKMAIAIDPERKGLRERHDELRAELAAQMSETYLKQARYEEEQGNWEAAARSWQKVAEGRPDDARAHRQAAAALLESKGDLRLARDMAQKAVQLIPGILQNRVVLAKVYLAAKMTASAKTELEEAAKLDPNAEIVKTLQRELK